MAKLYPAYPSEVGCSYLGKIRTKRRSYDYQALQEALKSLEAQTVFESKYFLQRRT